MEMKKVKAKGKIANKNQDRQVTLHTQNINLHHLLDTVLA